MKNREYVDFYSEHFKPYLEIEGKTYIVNDIADYEDFIVLNNTKKWIGLTESEFINIVNNNFDNSIAHLDLKALWKLSICLFNMDFLQPVAEPILDYVDHFKKFMTLMMEGMEVESVTIKGKLNGKTKNVSFNDKELVDIIVNNLKSQDILNKPRNYITVFKCLYQIYDHSTLNYLFAKSLTDFFTAFLETEKLPTKYKVLIMSILSAFKLEVKDKSDSYESLEQKYNKLMYDGNKNRIDMYPYNQTLAFLGDKLMPIGVCKNKKAIEIERKYQQALKKFRK